MQTYQALVIHLGAFFKAHRFAFVLPYLKAGIETLGKKKIISVGIEPKIRSDSIIL